MSTCRSCNAPIIWVKTVNGRRHPLDATPVPDGEWIIVPSIADKRMLRYTPLNTGELRYRSHFATCANAQDHRRPRRVTTHTSRAKAVGE